jgi:hypothetical protein
MADQVTSVGIPADAAEGNGVKVETETRSEDAPWGLKDDGTPYKVDPARYRKRDAKRRGTRAPSAKSKAKVSPYRETVLGLVQIIGLPIAAAATRDDRFGADLVALTATAPDIADAVDSIAQNNRRLAAALDKLGEVGPYGLLIGALAPLILQCGTNHGIVPVGTLGTVDPAVLLAAAEAGEIPGMEAAA